MTAAISSSTVWVDVSLCGCDGRTSATPFFWPLRDLARFVREFVLATVGSSVRPLVRSTSLGPRRHEVVAHALTTFFGGARPRLMTKVPDLPGRGLEGAAAQTGQFGVIMDA
jgi:hypothetical protein